MKLNAKVTTTARESDRGLVFGGDVEGGGWLFKLPNTEGYALDDELVVLVLTKEQAASLSISLELVVSHGYAEFASLRDQLRHDELLTESAEAAHG